MKLLYITSLSGRRVNGFMRSAIVAAKKAGYDFVMACNADDADKEGYQKDCEAYGIRLEHIDFDRNPLSLGKNTKAYRQILALMTREHFDIVHCNTPIGGFLGRICAKKAGIKKVIYMVHGFHFWKGAPLKNWLLYYPVERFLAHYTDILVTINQEDYQRVERFRLRKNGELVYIHGVGVDTNKFAFHLDEAAKKEIRKANGIAEDAVVFISVGELNGNKNQMTLIKAFQQVKNPNAVLLVCGGGIIYRQLDEYVKSNRLDHVRLLGHRTDVPDLLAISDVFVHPSFREGLPSALMEGMSAGLKCAASKIRGNVDLLGKDYPYLFDPSNADELALRLNEIQNDGRDFYHMMRNAVSPYDIQKVIAEFVALYQKIAVS